MRMQHNAEQHLINLAEGTRGGKGLGIVSLDTIDPRRVFPIDLLVGDDFLLAVKNCKCSEGNPRPGFEPGAPRDVVSIDPSIRGVFQYTSWLEMSF
jgi:hypothetical protein